MRLRKAMPSGRPLQRVVREAMTLRVLRAKGVHLYGVPFVSKIRGIL